LKFVISNFQKKTKKKKKKRKKKCSRQSFKAGLKNEKIFFFYTKHSKKSRVDSTRLRVDRIDTHLRHTNPTTLRVESTRDFLLCRVNVPVVEQSFYSRPPL
jgi:hypothetical protein